MKDKPHGVPMGGEPAQKQFDIDDGWEPGEITEHKAAGVRISVAGPEERPEVAVLDWEGDKEEALWTAVHWAREYGIPGVWKEQFQIDGEKYRLGALYRLAGFDLTERERDYIEYGETPYDPESEELGHGRGR